MAVFFIALLRFTQNTLETMHYRTHIYTKYKINYVEKNNELQTI